MEKAKEIADTLEKALQAFYPEGENDREVMRLAGQLVGAVQVLASQEKEV